jgi:hypothetical protein
MPQLYTAWVDAGCPHRLAPCRYAAQISHHWSSPPTSSPWRFFAREVGINSLTLVTELVWRHADIILCHENLKLSQSKPNHRLHTCYYRDEGQSIHASIMRVSMSPSRLLMRYERVVCRYQSPASLNSLPSPADFELDAFIHF